MRQALRHLARKWACKFGHRMCRNAAFQRMLVYLDNDELDEIPEHWRYWILCDGMKLVNLDIWKRFLNKIMNKTNTEVFLKYLLCTENSSIIEHYLTLIIRTNYFQKIKQSVGLLCRDVIRKHVKNKDVLLFVLNNIDAIMNRFSHDFPLGILLGDIITNVYSFGDLDMIIEYAEKYSWIKIELAPSFNSMITNWRRYLMKVLSKFQMFHDRV
ncbi:uncharacterized protein LOC116851927 [Odontomachus brunneus]|uniref:uncharacterized protein LOC116851927 n=1 Tax=Odontomachus brunneus TaxID=486640 RepID=UPI0013F2A16C|nr:uncharacterized protein LOC116851927 [Odontomachus brunneus]